MYIKQGQVPQKWHKEIETYNDLKNTYFPFFSLNSD